MTLPDLLAQAARLMPERFTYDWPRRVIEVNMPMTISRTAPAQWRTAYYWDDTDWELDDSCALLWVEHACREELEARGWDWIVRSCRTTNDPPERMHTAVVWAYGVGQAIEQAPTPAEALLSALIHAVEGERA
jgi:hypothetical protein